MKKSNSFRFEKDQRQYWVTLTVVLVVGVLFAIGLLVYNNPVPMTSPSFWPVVQRRINAVIAMAIVALAQSLATVTFQSVTNNRIITPSILGFESLYTTIQTAVMFFFGSRALLAFTGTGPFLFQVGLMILLSLLLYGWLLTGKYGDLQLMLLIGLIIGSGLRSLSTFMRRLLSPSEFDLLQARLFASVNHADPGYFGISIVLIALAALLLFWYARRLNVLNLGKDVAVSLGVHHRRGTIFMLVLVSVLMSVSTALVGPMTFFGFLVATFTYRLVPTYDHRYYFPMAIGLGFLVMTGSYFLMYHVFNAQGVVSILIEFVGGLTFLFTMFRRGEE